jgi:hypothetical protein
MNWTIIDDWKMDREYATNSVVIFEDILYKSNGYIDEENAQKPIRFILSKEVKSAPYNINEWDYYNPTDNIFWSPVSSYDLGDYVYNSENYYMCVNNSGDNFWNPEIAKTVNGYDLGETVLFKGKYYISLTSSNNFPPDYSRPWFVKRQQGILKEVEFNFTRFWGLTQSNNPFWVPIEVWNPNTIYVLDGQKLVIHDDIIWQSNTTNDTIDADEEPGVSIFWQRKYSLKPDTKYVYNSNNNPIIELNNRYYLINSNTTDSTLENGIIVYINKKWKNIFINIAINDNTLPNINNADRDVIYDDLYKKITAYNFIQAMNDISNKYDFTDFVKYVIIDEMGNVNTYSNNNITSLPYIIKCEEPDFLDVKVKSLDVVKVETPKNLKPSKFLRNGQIRNMNQLNWYNDVPLAYNIIENKFAPKVFELFHGNKNILVDNLYRFSGYYMPLFYEIQLFEKDFEFGNIGNYKFDTSLSEFGIMKERRFRKANRKGSVLKLKDTVDSKSIYPMIDEFGYSVDDFFIFRSTWDLQYHNETVENKQRFLIDISDVIATKFEEIGKQPNLENKKFTL